MYYYNTANIIRIFSMVYIYSLLIYVQYYIIVHIKNNIKNKYQTKYYYYTQIPLNYFYSSINTEYTFLLYIKIPPPISYLSAMLLSSPANHQRTCAQFLLRSLCTIYCLCSLSLRSLFPLKKEDELKCLPINDVNVRLLNTT